MSKKQREVRLFIALHLAEGRLCPTHREIAFHFGFASSFAAACHVKALVSKGFLIAESGKARALRLADAIAHRAIAYSGGCRTLIPISVGQRSDFCRTPFRFISDSVPG